LRVEAVECPTCKAPLAAPSGGGMVLCVYCNACVRVAPLAAPTDDAGSTGARHAARAEVSPEAVERVKQLILDGRQAEAVRFFAEAAQLPVSEAAAAVDRIAVTLTLNLTRQAPLAPAAIGIAFLILAAHVVGIVLTARAGLGRHHGWLVLTAVLALLAFSVLRALLPKLVSSWVLTRGPIARARIRRIAIVRRGFRPGGALVTAAIEVRPDGEEPFVDE
jgi:hypothetical protein